MGGCSFIVLTLVLTICWQINEPYSKQVGKIMYTTQACSHQIFLRLLYNDFVSSSSIVLKDCKVLLGSIHCIDLFSPLCLVTFFSSAEIENSNLNSYVFALLSIKDVCKRAVTYRDRVSHIET